MRGLKSKNPENTGLSGFNGGSCFLFGGEGGIRTPGTVTRSAV